MASRRRITKNESVFHQGDRPARFHALLSGWIRILQCGSDGEQSVIRFIRPGEVFGLFALFTGHGYPADATAVVDCVELSWSESHLHQLIERYPAIATNLVGVAGARLSELQERFREVTTQRAEQRLANALLRMWSMGSTGSGQRGDQIPVPVTRKDAAALAGITLYTASRIMSAWERRGILSSSGRRITIVMPSTLEDIGQSY